MPHIYDFAKSEDDKKIMHVLYGTHALGRPISGPPGIPADRTEALRKAFNATMVDPDFLAEARKQDMPIAPLTGEQTEKFIAQFAKYPSAVYDRAMKILEAGEVVNVKLKVLEGSVANVASNVLTVDGGNGKAIKLEVDARETSVTIGRNKVEDIRHQARHDVPVRVFWRGRSGTESGLQIGPLPHLGGEVLHTAAFTMIPGGKISSGAIRRRAMPCSSRLT